MIDEFYKLEDVQKSPMKEIGFISKIYGHLKEAKEGNRDAESRMINRLGSVRRSFGHPDNMSEELSKAVAEAVQWLRSEGRTVDFGNEDPAKWISRRDGSPRW